MTRVYLSPPEVGAEERRMLLEAFDSNWIAPLGPDVDAFEAAWQTVIDRHPNLRVSFLWRDVERPLQRVHRRVPAGLVRLDWRDANTTEQTDRTRRYVEAIRARGFALDRAPQFHLALARLADDRYALIWCYSYLLQDGWSREFLLSELFHAYDVHLAHATNGDTQGAAHADANTPPGHEAYVRWLLRHERDHELQFAPLRGETAAALRSKSSPCQRGSKLRMSSSGYSEPGLTSPVRKPRPSGE